MFVTKSGSTWTVNELSPSGNVLASGLASEPSVSDIATLLRQRGESTVISFDRLLKGNDGAYRAAGGGMVSQGIALLSGASVS